ncbi:MAG: malto-oligosyltrehalose trehalohydrolase [Ignavibacteriaceae bacterium]
MKIGAACLGNNECEFTVWATKPGSVSLKIVNPFERIVKMERDDFFYWKVKLKDVPAGTKYFYRLNDSEDRPDPASSFQPDDVHSASEVIDHSAFYWSDKNWKGIELKDLIIYELHTGTFTEEGTFESAIKKLDYLYDLGITAIEIMPVSQFPGKSNWGYDGCYPFAPQNSYGGPEGLKKLIDAAHKKGLAVILDVVYNHFGPEGNYSGLFAHYSTSKYRTPWGDAINYDHEYSYGVRNYFLENAKHWLVNYHIDGLRLDAIDTIYDLGAKHFLRELAENVEKISYETGRKHFLIAESDLNDVKIIKPVSECGYGINAQWSDNFHHSIHSLLTGEKEGYYIDFGEAKHLAESIKKTFVYAGNYSVFRKRNHGNDASGRPPYQFVICLQNHDQIGNRAFGERLTSLISYEGLKLAAGMMFLTPYIPLLFMGEEYGEENPFLYFVSHSDENLKDAIRKGRKEEFSSFKWSGEIPDPFSSDTFIKSKLSWEKLSEQKHKTMHDFYRNLIRLRKNLHALQSFDRENFHVSIAEDQKVIQLNRLNGSERIFAVFNFNSETVTTLVDFPRGNWKKIFDSASEKWLGSGESTIARIIGKKQNLTIRKLSFSLYEMEN